MTTAELLAALVREYPNGVSFNPMALRLLRQRVPFENWQIEGLKATMFQLRNGLWFSREMIADDETRRAFEGQAMKWIAEHGCFSAERLFTNFFGVLRHIGTVEDCVAFLRHLGFVVEEWRTSEYLCLLPPPNLNDSLSAIAETIVGWLEEADGMLPFYEIEEAMPHMGTQALESIRARFLPGIHETEIEGITCWRSTESIILPGDFSEKLTTIVDTLVVLEEKVSPANLEFALNLFYCTHFRNEYALLDNNTFMRTCVKYYQGGNDAFSNTKKSRAPGGRVRRPNTRFSNLGVPVGAELVFTNDPHISCVVLNDINQVEYNGKVFSISALAVHLLEVPSVNGFQYFNSTFGNGLRSKLSGLFY